METEDTPPKTIKATRTAFDIIESVAKRDHPTVSAIASDVDHSRSTVHYHLKTLQQERYLVKDDEGFRLGLRMARLGTLSLESHPLGGLVEEPAEELTEEADAAAHVAIREGDRLAWLYRSREESGDLATSVGEDVPIHCTAYGQVILAYAPAETVSDIIERRGLSAETPHTLTDRDVLEERLDTVRDIGFAYSAQERVEDVSSIAAPIIDEDDEIVGSIGITDTHERIDNPYKHAKARRFSDELPGQVRKAARIVGNRLRDQ